MLFNSPVFVFFFASVLVAYYLSPHRFRWMLLLAASLFFYAAWNPALLGLMLFIIAVNYTASQWIVWERGRSQGQARLQGQGQKQMRRNPLPTEKLVLAAAVVLNLSVLVVFKYANFLGGTANFILSRLCLGTPVSAPEWHILLPMGISFYTFQAMSYTIDVYRRQLQPERNFAKFTLFITFFPQLVAGPIERAANLMPQLFSRKTFALSNIKTGLPYLLLGYFKKMVIADRVATAVNTVYNNPYHHAGLPAVIATLLFAFQIYCDFSGYSDIAMGCAKMLGIDLMQNFKQPYLSKGIRTFWRRWHVSLSSWFKDYVYFPLGGSRVSKPRHYLNTLATFLISGLWHGANWTFVLWGALHGLYQIAEDGLARLGMLLRLRLLTPMLHHGGDTGHIHIAERFVKYAFRSLRPLANVGKWCLTFMLVCFAWIFFRANYIDDAFFIAGHLFTDAAKWTSPAYVYDVLNGLGVQLIELVVGGGGIGLLIALELFAGERTVHEALVKTPLAVRWGIYGILVMAILSTGVFGNANAFIYFQF